MADIERPKPSNLRLLVLAPSAETFIDQAAEDSSQTEKTSYSNSRALFSLFLTGLTRSAPSKDLTTFAGYTSHPPLCIRNKYYSSDVVLWCDELPQSTASKHKQGASDLEQWTNQMLSAEAKEAREVIGGIVVVLSHVNTSETTNSLQKAEAEGYMDCIKAVNELRDLIEDESGRDIATIVVLQDMTPVAAAIRRADRERTSSVTSFTETLEEVCVSDCGIFGWDIVAWQPEFELSSENTIKRRESSGGTDHDSAERPRNEYGEQMGMARILEILEQTNWTASVGDAEADEGYGLLSTDDILDSDDELTSPGLRPRIGMWNSSSKDAVTEQSDEFQREIMGLHFALEEQRRQQTEDDQESGDDLQVDQLAALMDRVIATREAAAEMSKEDREKFARREVSRIMREMDKGSSLQSEAPHV